MRIVDTCIIKRNTWVMKSQRNAKIIVNVSCLLRNISHYDMSCRGLQWCDVTVFEIHHKSLILQHCVMHTLDTLFENSFFVQKFNFDFPRRFYVFGNFSKNHQFSREIKVDLDKKIKLCVASYWRHTRGQNNTVRNLHFLSKNSTLISRENCRFFGVKTRENVVVLDFLAVDNFDFTRNLEKSAKSRFLRY